MLSRFILKQVLIVIGFMATGGFPTKAYSRDVALYCRYEPWISPRVQQDLRLAFITEGVTDPGDFCLQGGFSTHNHSYYLPLPNTPSEPKNRDIIQVELVCVPNQNGRVQLS